MSEWAEDAGTDAGAPPAELRVFGVRHHGPGSARALDAALAAFAPDCVLVEGPPDADDLIPWLAHPALILPVALLVYCPAAPRRATFYPFAAFSPEYRALRYALEQGIEGGFMDLPRRQALAADVAAALPAGELFAQLATAAGHEGYEPWWNEAVEQRQTAGELFAAVLEMATELRAGEPPGPAENARPAAQLAAAREAAMRQRLRAAAAAGRQRIAAVCGAYHAPALTAALATPPNADAALLRALPVVEVAAAWIPWTYGRLAQGGGYGAGVASPGWYEHLWATGEAAAAGPAAGVAVTWLARVAALLREQGFDASPGHVIEAVRLAEALAALRGRPFPALPELDEATQSVLCGGDAEPMALIRRRLVVGERLGSVPPDAPVVPLQRDLAAQQTRLALPPQPEPSALPLDLRRERDLDRSRLLHRLALLDIPWGEPAKAAAQAGTYGELWQLQWRPELSLRVVEAAAWGNTVRDAAAAFAGERAAKMDELPALIALIDRAVAADLPEAIPAVLARIEALSAGGADVAHTLAALPPLAQVLRYGGLRQTAEHLPLLRRVFDHLLTRACLALPRASVSIDAVVAGDLAERLSAAATAVRLAGEARGQARWAEALLALADRRGVQAIVAGRATRLLHEAMGAPAGAPQPPAAIGPRLARALSGGAPDETRYAADWLDGLLRDSGLLLVHDRSLSDEIDRWLLNLSGERFVEVLPLLRRTFAAYPEGVREQLRRQLPRRPGTAAPDHDGRPADFDPARAAAALPIVGRLLGLSLPEEVEP